MALNINICRDCINHHRVRGEKKVVKGWCEDDDIRWSKGKVMCPSLCFGFKRDVSICWSLGSGVPSGCLYYLESIICEE